MESLHSGPYGGGLPDANWSGSRFVRKPDKSRGGNPDQNSLQTHRVRDFSGQLRRVIDFLAETLAARLIADRERTRKRWNEKKSRILSHRLTHARVGIAAVFDRAVLLVWTGMSFFCLRYGPLHSHAGIDRLRASHHQKCQRANDP